MTFIIGRDEQASPIVPVTRYIAGRGAHVMKWQSLKEAKRGLDPKSMVAKQITPGQTAFTIGQDLADLREHSLVAGPCEYIGRDGIQFYPQELLLFKYLEKGPRPEIVWLENVQLRKAQHPVPRGRALLETKYLHPLVKAPSIRAFKHDYDGILVPFPHEPTSPRLAITDSVLRRTSPALRRYYRRHRDVLENLSRGNTRVRSGYPDEFYSLARVGPYSFASVHVAFRKDTKWCAAVVSSEMTPWRMEKRLVFQSHAVSMCERQSGGFITDDEAHYICAILNAPIV